MFRITRYPSPVNFFTVIHDRTINVILAKHCLNLPDDGSLVIRNMLEQALGSCDRAS